MGYVLTKLNQVMRGWATYPPVRDVLVGDQDGRPRRARTDVLSRCADRHAMHKIAGLLPRRPHLPMSGRRVISPVSAAGLVLKLKTIGLYIVLEIAVRLRPF
jgi:hypothetical protein